MSATCLDCGGDYDSKRTDSLFCSARCKAKYHRHHDPVGTVRSVRRLMRGRVSVVVWFDEHEAPRALSFSPNLKVVMGRDKP